MRSAPTTGRNALWEVDLHEGACRGRAEHEQPPDGGPEAIYSKIPSKGEENPRRTRRFVTFPDAPPGMLGKREPGRWVGVSGHCFVWVRAPGNHLTLFGNGPRRWCQSARGFRARNEGGVAAFIEALGLPRGTVGFCVCVVFPFAICATFLTLAGRNSVGTAKDWPAKGDGMERRVSSPILDRKVLTRGGVIE